MPQDDEYLGQDPAALSTSEDLDEDELRVDPLERGVEPPERWSSAQRTDPETHEDRLAAEEPEAPVVPPDDNASGVHEGPTRRTEPDDLPEEARRGQSADAP